MSASAKKGSLRKKIYISYFVIAAIGVIIFSASTFVTSKLKDSSLTLANKDIPRTVALLKVQVGLNRAFASLRGWVAIKDISLRQENIRTWDEDIFPAISQLENAILKEDNPSVTRSLTVLKQQIVDLKEWQWYIAEAAISDGNLPAQLHLEQYVIPIYHDILDLLVKLIKSTEQSTAANQQSDQYVVLANMLNALAEHQSGLALFVSHGDDDTRQAVVKAQATFARYLEITRSDTKKSNKRQRDLFHKLEKQYSGYRILVEQVVAFRNDKNWHLANSWLRDHALPLSISIHENLEQILAIESNNLKTDVDSIIDISEKSLWLFILLLLTLVCSALFMAQYWTHKLMSPIQLLVKASNELAEGNLEFSIKTHSNDEIGELANSFDSMRLSLRKRAHQLISSETQLRTTIATVLDAIIVIDDRGIIQSVNPAACNLFQYQEEKLLGQNVKLLMPEPYKREHDGYLRKYQETHEEHVIGTGREVTGLRADNSEFPAHLSVNKMNIGEQQQFVGLVRDITEGKRVERMKDEFISTVSHELRTPLTSIKGSLGLIVGGKLGPLSDKAMRMLEIAYENSDRLALLINDLLDINKIQSTESTFHMNSIDINTLISKSIIANQGFADKYGVQYLWQPSKDDNVYISGDENRLIQVLSNLLSNAVKYSPKDTKIVISTNHDNKEVRVSVADSGPGIPPEYQDRIFDRFTQADSSDTRQLGGTGLGLAITKEIIEKHGGRIGFDSTPGHGSTFYFDLPIVESAAPDTE